MSAPLRPIDVFDDQFNDALMAIIQIINQSLIDGGETVKRTGKWDATITIQASDGDVLFNVWKAYHDQIIARFVKQWWSFTYLGYGTTEDAQPTYIVHGPKQTVKHMAEVIP